MHAALTAALARKPVGDVLASDLRRAEWMMSQVEKVLARLRDERGLGDRRALAREAAQLIERLQAENTKLREESARTPEHQ